MTHLVVPTLEIFPSMQDLAAEAAGRLVAVLRAGVAARGAASFAASGGSTPGPIYRAMAEQAAPWENVCITLADERDVPPRHAASNERLVREQLCVKQAAAARFAPLDQVETVTLPLDGAVFGMGTDGHTLSWFPGARGLADALHGAQAVARVIPAALPPDAPYGRWTLTRSAVAPTRLAILAISGASKRDVLERAITGGLSHEQAPVLALISALGPRLQVLWTP